MKSLILKIHLRGLFRKLVLAVSLKVVLKVAKEARTENLVRLSKQSSKLVRIFKEASRNFTIIFFIHKFKMIRCIVNTDLIE
jgi:hypothetical protein